MLLAHRGIPLIAIVAWLAACTSSGGTTAAPPPPPVVSIASGNVQSATVGAAVATNPAVQVQTSTGSPVSGYAVTFAVATGGGSATGLTQTTDVSGIAHVGGWTLGTTPGANSLTATAAGATGSPLTFTASGIAGAAASVSKQGGDGQATVVGTAVDLRPAVKVVDRFGNPDTGVPVAFAVTGGGGSITGGSQLTGSDGTAAVGSWTLGPLVGANALTATVAGSGLTGNPAIFSATGTVGSLTTMTKVAGDNQTALSGAAVATAPAVKLTDFFGNLIANQPVIFAVASGGGSVTGGVPSSGLTGIATIGSWILGAAGANTLTATAGTQTATFTATAQAVLNAAQYAGTYTGTWTNTTFASTGTGSAVVAVNASTSTVTATVSSTGQVLGSASGVPQEIYSGGYGATSMSFSRQTVPVMGDIMMSIDTAGHLILSGVHIPNMAITRWDANGTITANTLNLNFTVTFAVGLPAAGSITMTKP
jgi:hypothetical protein